MYWEKAGRENTDGTIDLAVKRAKELGIKDIVAASNTGFTVEKLLAKGDGFNIVCVTHHVGFREHGGDEMGEEKRKYLTEKGVKLLTTTRLFGGVGRAVRMKRSFGYIMWISGPTFRTAFPKQCILGVH